MELCLGTIVALLSHFAMDSVILHGTRDIGSQAKIVQFIVKCP